MPQPRAPGRGAPALPQWPRRNAVHPVAPNQQASPSENNGERWPPSQTRRPPTHLVPRQPRSGSELATRWTFDLGACCSLPCPPALPSRPEHLALCLCPGLPAALRVFSFRLELAGLSCQRVAFGFIDLIKKNPCRDKTTGAICRPCNQRRPRSSRNAMCECAANPLGALQRCGAVRLSRASSRRRRSSPCGREAVPPPAPAPAPSFLGTGGSGGVPGVRGETRR